jgi:hypothetical protein
LARHSLHDLTFGRVANAKPELKEKPHCFRAGYLICSRPSLNVGDEIIREPDGENVIATGRWSSSLFW